MKRSLIVLAYLGVLISLALPATTRGPAAAGQGPAISRVSIPVSIADTATAAANTQVVLTYPAQGIGIANMLQGVSWSYTGGTPTGTLTIADNGGTIRSWGITTSGPGYFPFPKALHMINNTPTTITLSAGGAGITGTVNADHYVE